MILNQRPEGFQLTTLNIINKDNTVRVAHGNAGDFNLSMLQRQLDGDRLPVCGADHRQVSPVQLGRPHVDLDPLNPTGLTSEHLQVEHPVSGLDLDPQLIDQAMIVGVFGNAADTVTAHLAFAAIRVEHAHLQIGL